MVEEELPPLFYLPNNNKGKTPIFCPLSIEQIRQAHLLTERPKIKWAFAKVKVGVANPREIV